MTNHIGLFECMQQDATILYFAFIVISFSKAQMAFN